jgi:hypothetical protein
MYFMVVVRIRALHGRISAVGVNSRSDVWDLAGALT